jgi:hypothetical protein
MEKDKKRATSWPISIVFIEHGRLLLQVIMTNKGVHFAECGTACGPIVMYNIVQCLISDERHSICYTGLFTTPRVVIIISPYNESWPSNILSRSGPWVSSVLNGGCWLTGWLLLTDWLTRYTRTHRETEKHDGASRQSFAPKKYRLIRITLYIRTDRFNGIFTVHLHRYQ